ncbi:MAG: hypothetical protein JHC34_04775 [Acidobacteria bacterium]|nr:hypothetical protein [Acidobacteriota bacterium]
MTLMGAEVLPHRYPFLMLDPVAGTARVRFSADDARCRGEMVPAWVLVETMAQAAGVAGPGEGASGGSLVQINRFRCPRPVTPGQTISLAMTVARKMGPLVRVRILARREGKLIATSILTLRLEGGA